MNKTFLVGNVTKDPKLEVTTSGISYCKFTIGIARRFANAQGEKETDFLNIITWRGLADNCANYLKKGSKVAVSGSIQTSKSEKDGIVRYYTDIVADDVEFLSPKSDGQQSQQPTYPQQQPTYSQNAQTRTRLEDMELMTEEPLPF